MLASADEYDIAMASILTVLMVTMTVALVWIITHQWRKVRVAAYNARLKQLMIERGMSAGEIERVLQAGGRSDAVKRFDANCCAGDARADRDRI